MTKKLILASAAFALASAPAVLASTPHGHWNINLDQGSGGVEFDATGHPSALKIVGKGSAPKGNLKVAGNNVSGVVSFDLNTLDTGIDMRTRHMKEKYLETAKYQQAKLTISHITLPQGASVEHLASSDLPFTGTLSLHGVEKPIAGTAKVESKDGKVTIAANFGLKVSDYGITIPTFAGITMADEVKVSVTDSAPLSVAN